MKDSTKEKAIRELLKDPAKREIGGHGDFSGFMCLIETAGDWPDTAKAPLKIECGTCRFYYQDFHAGPCMSCWAGGSNDFPKWRPST